MLLVTVIKLCWVHVERTGCSVASNDGRFVVRSVGKPQRREKRTSGLSVRSSNMGWMRLYIATLS